MARFKVKFTLFTSSFVDDVWSLPLAENLRRMWLISHGRQTGLGLSSSETFSHSAAL